MRYHSNARFNVTIAKGNGGTEGEEDLTVFYEQKVQFVPQMYFFVIADCEERTIDEGDPMRFDLTMSIFNNGSHFSEDDHGLIFFYISAFLVFSVILGANTYNYIKDIMKYEMPDSPVLLLMMSITLQIGHITFQLLHLFIYSYNGKGFLYFDVLSTLQLIIS